MTDIEQFKALIDGDPRKLIEDSTEHKLEQNVLERWSGIVIDNNDPNKLGRCRIKVMGFYDDIEDSFLPWAVPDISYIGSSKGSFIIPEIGTIVRGYFDKGDVQKPIYDSIAFNKNNAEDKFTSRTDNTDYPHKMVLLETDQGDFLTLNRKTGEMVFTHRTGTTTRIDENGNMYVESSSLNKANLEVEINGNVVLKSNGDVNVSANGNINVNSVRGIINLGNNPAKQLVNNIPVCPVIGCPLSVGNTQVYV